MREDKQGGLQKLSPLSLPPRVVETGCGGLGQVLIIIQRDDVERGVDAATDAAAADDPHPGLVAPRIHVPRREDLAGLFAIGRRRRRRGVGFFEQVVRGPVGCGARAVEDAQSPEEEGPSAYGATVGELQRLEVKGP